MPHVVEANDLGKRYGARMALDGVDLTVDAGEVTVVAGRNGSGKTTLFRILLGLVSPTAGSGTMFGRDLGRPGDWVHLTGSLVEAPKLEPRLTGRRNLNWFADISGVDRARVDLAASEAGIDSELHTKVAAYSQGMKQRLGLAAALLHRPALLFLDEPTNGLDPAGQQAFWELVGGLRDRGVAVVLATHQLHQAGADVADRVMVLAESRVTHRVHTDDLDALATATVTIRRQDVLNPSARALLGRHPQVTVTEAEFVGGPARPEVIDDLVARLLDRGVAPSRMRVRTHGWADTVQAWLGDEPAVREGPSHDLR